MANRKPLVNNAGELTEIPAGDAIQLASGGIRFSDNSVQTTAGSGSGITRTTTTSSGNFTADAVAQTDYVYLIAGAHTPTLPTAVGNNNMYTFKNNHSSNITIDTTSSQTIDGTTTISLAPQDAVDLISDNTNWSIV